MSEVEILAFFGSHEVYSQRMVEVGIEVRMGPIKKRCKHERPFYTGIGNAEFGTRTPAEVA